MLVTNREHATFYVGKQQEKTGHFYNDAAFSKVSQFVYGRPTGSWPETGIWEITPQKSVSR
jgi:hypothetical protein